MLLNSPARRETRFRQMAVRLARLADVDVTPSQTATGRIITVAVQPPLTAAHVSPPPQQLQNYVRPWWTTLQRVGLPGTLLHSGWTREQIAAIETGRITAVAVSPGARHIFHERHFLVRDYLHSIDDPYVFVTDGSDVAFKRDPFDLVRQAGNVRRLFIGREKHRILFCKCVRREMRRQFGRVWFPLRPVLNPGILGGRRETVIEALDAICELIDSLGEQVVASDMCIVNRGIHSAFTPSELMTGLPLHSQFKSWDFDTPAAILHK
ncbi:MAG: hypothetical protein ACK5Q5_23500 [Planctomycetaceae bacterium]